MSDKVSDARDDSLPGCICPSLYLDLMPVKAKVVNADPIRFKSMFMLGGLWLAHRYVLQVEGPNESF